MLPSFLNSSTTGCEREPLDAEMRAVLFSRAATLNSTQPLTRAKAPLQLPSSTASSCRALARKALPLEDGHPVIDLTPLEPSPNAKGSHVTSTRDDVVGYLREALVNHGHFYAKTSVLSQEYIASIYEYARRAHALPAAVKQQYHPAYNGPDIGKPELAYATGTVSTVRSWDYSRTRFTQESARADQGAPRFPPASVLDPPFAGVLDELYENQNRLSELLLGGLAETLELPSETLKAMFSGPDRSGDFGTIRLLHYPGSPQLSDEERERANVGISAHTDFEAFTLMHQDAPGLQLLVGSSWIDAPVRPGEFMVIVGDVLERLTNGVLRATPHRVKLTEHPRNSIIRFTALHPDTVVAPLPQFVSAERPAAYTPVTMRRHMETTIRNLERGLPAWDNDRMVSTTATYHYD